MAHNKQIEAAEAVQAATIKTMQDAASYMTVEERDAAARLKLYFTLEARNALDIYYHLYPDERPKGEQARVDQSRDVDGRER